MWQQGIEALKQDAELCLPFCFSAHQLMQLTDRSLNKFSCFPQVRLFGCLEVLSHFCCRLSKSALLQLRSDSSCSESDKTSLWYGALRRDIHGNLLADTWMVEAE